jgi:hydrogenase-4 component H
MVTVKLKTLAEALRSLTHRAYTVKYPYVPSPPPETFRGKPEYNAEKCTGCGACVQACPPGAVSLVEVDGKRTIEVWYGKCTYCGRCQEVCPEEAVKLTQIYDLTTYEKEEIKSKVELPLILCQKCGRPITTQRQDEKLFSKVKPLNPPQGYFEYFKLCTDCRKTFQAKALLGRRIRV